MERLPVILSPTEDPNAAAVSWGLRQWGVEPLWAPSLCGGLPEALSIHDGEEGSRVELGSARAEGIGAVWYRRPRAPRPGAGVLESDRPFVQGEWELFQRNVFALASGLTGALWVNAPRAALETENKLVQLQAARQVGLRVPETLMSHDVRTIRAFIARHGRVIYKTFMPHTWRSRETGQLYNVTATVLDSASDFEDAAVSMCPGIYQRYVEKVWDVRVTLIGERLFPVRLRSSGGEAFVDWRAHAGRELAADACELPERCQRQLRALMGRLGLVFGCVDLVVDGDGGLHFLEVNQSGQFLFVEDLVKSQPLLQAMCALLLQGRVDYTLEPSRQVSLERYRSSEDFHAWMSQHGNTLKGEGLLHTAEGARSFFHPA